jgi:hypothetical protein
MSSPLDPTGRRQLEPPGLHPDTPAFASLNLSPH